MTRPRVALFLHRTSGWPIVGVVSIGVFALAIRTVLVRSAGDWWWSYNILAQTLPVVIVATAFVAGWDAGAPGSGVADLSALVPRRRLAIPVLRNLTSGWAALVSYVLAFLVLLVITVNHGGRPDWRIAYVLPDHLLMLVFASAIGTYMGRRMSSAYAGLAAAAIAAALAFVASAPGQELFGLNGGSAPATGFVPSTAYFGWNLIALVSCGGMLLYAAGEPRLPRDARRVQVVPGVVLAAVLATSLFGPSDKFVASTETASRCFTSSVQVCVFPGYDRLGTQAAVGIGHLLDLAAQQGVAIDAFPHRYLQYGGGHGTERGTATLEMPIGALRQGSISPMALADSISAPTWCSAMFGSVAPVRMLAARQLVLDWLLFVSRYMPAGVMAQLHPRFARLSRQERAVMISSKLHGLAQCAN